MTSHSYDVGDHRRQALRMIYQARSNVAHLDAAVIGPEELELVQELVEDLRDLEVLLEDRLAEAGLEPGLSWEDEGRSAGGAAAPADD